MTESEMLLASMTREEGERLRAKLLSRTVERDGPLDTPCWIWIWGRNANGYGKMRWNGFGWLAHRLSYGVFVGPFPSDLHCLHICDVPSCIRPEHIHLGTDQDNVDDRKLRGADYSYLIGEGNGNASITEVQAAEIKWLALEGVHSQQAIADFYGIDQRHVSRIKLGISWPDVVPVAPTEWSPLEYKLFKRRI
jgi:hypothetical protein